MPCHATTYDPQLNAHHVSSGERFNADKKGIGFYHSTRIWQFSMRHHCGCIITIQTDPKRAEYIVVEGARKKVCMFTTWSIFTQA